MWVDGTRVCVRDTQKESRPARHRPPPLCCATHRDTQTTVRPARFAWQGRVRGGRRVCEGCAKQKGRINGPSQTHINGPAQRRDRRAWSESPWGLGRVPVDLIRTQNGVHGPSRVWDWRGAPLLPPSAAAAVDEARVRRWAKKKKDKDKRAVVLQRRSALFACMHVNPPKRDVKVALRRQQGRVRHRGRHGLGRGSTFLTFRQKLATGDSSARRALDGVPAATPPAAGLDPALASASMRSYSYTSARGQSNEHRCPRRQRMGKPQPFFQQGFDDEMALKEEGTKGVAAHSFGLPSRAGHKSLAGQPTTQVPSKTWRMTTAPAPTMASLPR